jgi:predicted RNA-binding Zn ribbon-like protein
VAITPTNELDVQLVRDFVNTRNLDEGTDQLSSPRALGAWLRGRDVLGEGQRVTDADLALARELREALRAELRSHHGGAGARAGGGDAGMQADAGRTLDAIAADLPLHVRFTGGAGGPALVPAVGPGARAGLATILASVASLARTGDWARLKACPADDCQWAFYDESRNRSRRWCSMEVCGNRSKLRAFRRRDRHD